MIEIWFDQLIESFEIFIQFFQVYRRDRIRYGGGILFVCNIELGCLRRLDFETVCEILWCEIIIFLYGLKFLVGVFYRSLLFDVVYLSELQKLFFLSDYSGINLLLLLFGDFNFLN